MKMFSVGVITMIIIYLQQFNEEFWIRFWMLNEDYIPYYSSLTSWIDCIYLLFSSLGILLLIILILPTIESLLYYIIIFIGNRDYMKYTLISKITHISKRIRNHLFRNRAWTRTKYILVGILSILQSTILFTFILIIPIIICSLNIRKTSKYQTKEKIVNNIRNIPKNDQPMTNQSFSFISFNTKFRVFYTSLFIYPFLLIPDYELFLYLPYSLVLYYILSENSHIGLAIQFIQPCYFWCIFRIGWI